MSESLAPGEWTPWERRAAYLLNGTLDDLLKRYQRDFGAGDGAADRWPK